MFAFLIHILSILLSTISVACLVERSTNQLSPSSTMISLVWINSPWKNPTDPTGT